MDQRHKDNAMTEKHRRCGVIAPATALSCGQPPDGHKRTATPLASMYKASLKYQRRLGIITVPQPDLQ